jgi:hypothetical protein
MEKTDMPIFNRALATAILLISTTGSLFAQETVAVHPHLSAKYFGDLGVYMPDRDLKLVVNGAVAGINDEVDFETSAQTKRSDNVFALDFGWRFGEKWSLRLQYFGNSPSKSAVLEQDIEWKDVVFGAGSNVTVGSDFTMFRTFFGRTFDSGERTDYGFGAGLHWLSLGAFIEGEAIVNGMPSGFRHESVSLDAPLPNIGAWWMYSLSPKWAVSARADWFSASIDDYDGGLTNLALGVNYQIFEHAGLGLSYNLFRLDLDVSKTAWNGSVSTEYSGLYANVSFYW